MVRASSDRLWPASREHTSSWKSCFSVGCSAGRQVRGRTHRVLQHACSGLSVSTASMKVSISTTEPLPQSASGQQQDRYTGAYLLAAVALQQPLAVANQLRAPLLPEGGRVVQPVLQQLLDRLPRVALLHRVRGLPCGLQCLCWEASTQAVVYLRRRQGAGAEHRKQTRRGITYFEDAVSLTALNAQDVQHPSGVSGEVAAACRPHLCPGCVQAASTCHQVQGALVLVLHHDVCLGGCERRVRAAEEDRFILS